MKKSKWFIIQEDSHDGPYSLSEIKNLIKDHMIDGETKLWTEGSSDWSYASNFSILSSTFNISSSRLEGAPPPLPPLPFEAQEQDQFNNEQALDIPPPLPPVPRLSKKPRLPKSALVSKEAEQEQLVELSPKLKEHLVEPTLKYEEYNEENHTELEAIEESVKETNTFEEQLISQKNTKPYSRISFFHASVFTCIIAVIGLTTSYLVRDFGKSFDDKYFFQDVTVSDFNSLMNNYKGSEERELPDFSIAMTKNADGIWISGNYPEDAAIEVTFTSLKGRVLGQGRTIFRSSGQYINRRVKIEKFNFLAGERLASGEYRVDIRGIEQGLKSKAKNLLEKRAKKSFSYTGTVILFGGDKKSFEKKLSHFHSKIKEKRLAPVKDLLEQYRTFNALLSQVDGLYKDVLASIKRGIEIRKFEGKYAGQVGLILQSLIIDNTHSYRDYLSKDPTKAKNYQRLLAYSKNIGGLASDMVTKTEKLKRIDQKKKDILLTHFSSVVESLKKEGQNQVQGLERVLGELSSSFLE